ncbi:universal stress protein [uncultured Microscilla sp.]|uniref:universal stress protein n=1 Tax=uncultured Microscilla sp. TaxID=432653 RepID=UPI0026353CB2|nr:universal stress protein [uncultured Microscilla sp.]
MKKILVPIDFSEQSINAFNVAKNIAKKADAEVLLLNVIEPYMPFSEVGYTATEQDYISHLKDTSVSHLKRMAEEDNGIKVSSQVEIGSIFKVIKTYINDQAIDLVVMGTQGASGLEEILIGSNTEKIVRTSACPVLTVRNTADSFEVKALVFATNLRQEQVKAVEILKEFQQFFGAHIHLVYVNTPNAFLSSHEIKEQSDEFVKKANLENFTLHVESDVNEEIGVIHAAENLGVDMIAMGTHQRKGLAHWFAGSIAEDVVNHANRPVLTFGLKN